MFLGLDGVLFDYFDGQTDLKNKHIRFVGEPEARVKEDYLRIFRYFRFHARFGCADKHDSQTLMTFKNNCEGLTRISGERIWSEIKRILIIKHCEDVIKVMFNDIGLGKYMGFKKNLNIINPNQNQNISEYFIDLSEFHEVLSRLTNAVDNRLIECWEPITLFSSLICDIEEFMSVSARLKLSNIEKETAIYIITNRSKFTNDLKAFQNQLALTHKPNQNHMRKFIIEFMKYSGLFSHIEIINNWKIPEFPFTGHLIGGRVKRRSHISSILNELKLIWVESNFQLTEEELKIKLDQILEQEIYKK
jgi:tRNA nucleotidyltransferase (CCA-adding enzyme)